MLCNLLQKDINTAFDAIIHSPYTTNVPTKIRLIRCNTSKTYYNWKKGRLVEREKKKKKRKNRCSKCKTDDSSAG